jgi:hypothetical protein
VQRIQKVPAGKPAALHPAEEPTTFPQARSVHAKIFSYVGWPILQPDNCELQYFSPSDDLDALVGKEPGSPETLPVPGVPETYAEFVHDI